MTTAFKIKSRLQKSGRLPPCGEETIMELIFRFTRDEAGTAALEYAIILTILGIALMASMSTISTALSGIFTHVSGHLTGG
jgi:pilus assembly protein Flp/PilA